MLSSGCGLCTGEKGSFKNGGSTNALVEYRFCNGASIADGTFWIRVRQFRASGLPISSVAHLVQAWASSMTSINVRETMVSSVAILKKKRSYSQYENEAVRRLCYYTSEKL